MHDHNCSKKYLRSYVFWSHSPFLRSPQVKALPKKVDPVGAVRSEDVRGETTCWNTTNKTKQYNLKAPLTILLERAIDRNLNNLLYDARLSPEHHSIPKQNCPLYVFAVATSKPLHGVLPPDL